MAHLVLHIGTKKTGTTAIQQWLFKNRKALRQQGWSYPEFLGRRNHLALALMFEEKPTRLKERFGLSEERDRAKLFDEVSAELAKQVVPGQKWIMTSEHFSSRLQTAKEVQDVIDFLRTYFSTITVVMSLRRQEFVLPSIYSQRTKTGGVVEWSSGFIRSQLAELDYELMIELWSSARGVDALKCFPFLEKERNDPTILLRRFADECGFEFDSQWQLPTQNRSNQSLSAEGIAMLQLVNSHLPIAGPPGSVALKMRDATVARLAELTPGPRFVPSHRDFELIADLVADQNGRVVDTLGGSVEWQEWLEQGDFLRSSAVPIPTLEAQRVVDLMVALTVPNGPIDWGRLVEPEQPRRRKRRIRIR